MAGVPAPAKMFNQCKPIKTMKSKSKEIPEYLMIKNPHTDEFVDIMPFFQFLDDYRSRGYKMADELQKVHDYLSTIFLDIDGTEPTPELIAEFCAITIHTRDMMRSIEK